MLYHTDVADGQGTSQKAFVETLALSDWIMLDNIFEKYEIRRHTPNASPLYVFAEKDLGNLIWIQRNLDLDSGTAIERLEKERYATPLSAALANANVNENTIRALFTPIAKTSYVYNKISDAHSDNEYDCSRAAISIIFKQRPKLIYRQGPTLMRWAATHGYEAVVRYRLSNEIIELDS